MPLPANFSSCVLGAGFFCDPQLPVVLRSVICYAQAYILHKRSLRKAVLLSRVYQCVAQHHTDKRCTPCKRIPEHGNSILPAASCHPAATNTAAAIPALQKIIWDLQLKTSVPKVEWYSAVCLSVLTEIKHCSREGACLAKAEGYGHFLILPICFIYGNFR